MEGKFNYNQIIEEQIGHLQLIQGNLKISSPYDIQSSILIAKTISELAGLINESTSYKSR